MQFVPFSTMSMRLKPAAHDCAAMAMALLMSGCAPEPAAPPAPLAPDTGQRAQVTVSGISAGGFMAVQTQVALADRVGGIAAIAAGPYHCAEGSVRTALSRCIGGDALDVGPFVAYARNQSEAARIAPVEMLADARVWLFHSREDSVVSAPVADALAAFYREFVDQDRVDYVTGVAAAHGWPTLASGSPCLELGGDYINACDYDAAGKLLSHLYGELQPRVETPAAPAIIDISTWNGGDTALSDTAYAYFPPGCRDNTAACRLHIAFHGCRQGSEFIDDRFAANTGLNNWAAANDIVVVYPQIEKSLSNPQGCWDWWGYTGDDYDLRSGKQIAVVARLIDAWSKGALNPD